MISVRLSWRKAALQFRIKHFPDSHKDTVHFFPSNSRKIIMPASRAAADCEAANLQINRNLLQAESDAKAITWRMMRV